MLFHFLRSKYWTTTKHNQRYLVVMTTKMVLWIRDIAYFERDRNENIRKYALATIVEKVQNRNLLWRGHIWIDPLYQQPLTKYKLKMKVNEKQPKDRPK